MALSKELVSKLVSTLNIETNRRDVAMLHGTVTREGYVKIDGAPENTDTPVSSTTDYKKDDRVIVMIQDHTAIITGNETSPAANLLTVTDIDEGLADLKETAIVASIDEFYLHDSPTDPPPENVKWDTKRPEWTEGKYIWKRTKNIHGDLSKEYSPDEQGVCITGNKGDKGDDAIVIELISSNGNQFKNNHIETIISATVKMGTESITNAEDLKKRFGASAYLRWSVKQSSDTGYTVISKNDERLSSDYFSLTIGNKDVNSRAIFKCELVI